MRKTKKITKTEVVNETVDILCNKCGKTCSNVIRKGYSKTNPHQEYSGILELEVHGGYDSATIGDMVSWKFSLCEFCLKDLVKTFKIPHEIRDSDISGEYMSLVENTKLVAQANKRNHQEWVKTILEKGTGYKKKELQGKTNKELYDIFYNMKEKSKG